MVRTVQLCRGFTDVQWRRLKPKLLDTRDAAKNAAAWQCAVEVFKRRLNERYLSAIVALEDSDSRADMLSVGADAPGDCSTLPAKTEAVVPGFAIVAICCLLMETLARFRDLSTPPRQNNELIDWFLTSPSFTEDFDEHARRSFVQGVRNGILHEAETRKWIIKREAPKGKICERAGDRYVLNRRLLTRALAAEVESYVTALVAGSDAHLRAKFMEQMEKIARRA